MRMFDIGKYARGIEKWIRLGRFERGCHPACLHGRIKATTRRIAHVADVDEFHPRPLMRSFFGRIAKECLNVISY